LRLSDPIPPWLFVVCGFPPIAVGPLLHLLKDDLFRNIPLRTPRGLSFKSSDTNKTCFIPAAPAGLRPSHPSRIIRRWPVTQGRDELRFFLLFSSNSVDLSQPLVSRSRMLAIVTARCFCRYQPMTPSVLTCREVPLRLPLEVISNRAGSFASCPKLSLSIVERPSLFFRGLEDVMIGGKIPL